LCPFISSGLYEIQYSTKLTQKNESVNRLTTEKKRPRALRKDPIFKATFEVRFKTDTPGIGDLLPGLLYPHLKDRYERVEALPSGELPKVVRDQLPNALYQGTKRLVGKGTNLNIGERAIAVDVMKPYWGWNRFSGLIFDVIKAISETDLVGEAERASLRYHNVLTTQENLDDISGLELEITLADYKLRDTGLQLRAEIADGGYITIVQVGSGAVANLVVDGKHTSVVGLLLDIDTIREPPLPTFWTDYKSIVEDIHNTEKEVFFSLLKDETINQMDPVYD